MGEISIGKADLKPGELRCFEANGLKLAVANVSGKYYCSNSTCTHEGGPLCEGSIDEKGALTCPWHGSVFDIRTGKVQNGPAVDAVKVYKVTVRKGELFISV